jgi:hypothetical protein
MGKFSIDGKQEHRNLYYMKATLDIPDELYRRVKARSAMEGRPVRSVAVQLFQNWLDESPSPEAQAPPSGLTEAELAAAPWLAISRRYVKPGMSHDMDEIRAAIAVGSAAETAEKLAGTDS